MRNLHKTLIDLCAGLTLVGCAGIGLGGDHVRWTEEVKLSDGKVIQIQRHGELTESGFPAQKRGLDKYHEICYPPMNIHWKSRGGYLPDIFDIVDGKAYMHVPVSAAAQCYEQGSPDTGAVYFVWDKGQWKRITHEEFPARSEWNLLQQVSRGSPATDPQGLITITDKTTGKWNDSGLRYERERFGWKRVSDSYASREGCAPWGKVSAPITELLINDGKNSCQP